MCLAGSNYLQICNNNCRKRASSGRGIELGCWKDWARERAYQRVLGIMFMIISYGNNYGINMVVQPMMVVQLIMVILVVQPMIVILVVQLMIVMVVQPMIVILYPTLSWNTPVRSSWCMLIINTCVMFAKILQNCWILWTGVCLGSKVEVARTQCCGWGLRGHVRHVIMTRVAITWWHN